MTCNAKTPRGKPTRLAKSSILVDRPCRIGNLRSLVVRTFAAARRLENRGGGLSHGHSDRRGLASMGAHESSTRTAKEGSRTSRRDAAADSVGAEDRYARSISP